MSDDRYPIEDQPMIDAICSTCFRPRDCTTDPDGNPICHTCEFRAWRVWPDEDDRPEDHTQDGPQ